MGLRRIGNLLLLFDPEVQQRGPRGGNSTKLFCICQQSIGYLHNNLTSACCQGRRCTQPHDFALSIVPNENSASQDLDCNTLHPSKFHHVLFLQLVCNIVLRFLYILLRRTMWLVALLLRIVPQKYGFDMRR